MCRFGTPDRSSIGNAGVSEPGSTQHSYPNWPWRPTQISTEAANLRSTGDVPTGWFCLCPWTVAFRPSSSSTRGGRVRSHPSLFIVQVFCQPPLQEYWIRLDQILENGPKESIFNAFLKVTIKTLVYLRDSECSIHVCKHCETPANEIWSWRSLLFAKKCNLAFWNSRNNELFRLVSCKSFDVLLGHKESIYEGCRQNKGDTPSLNGK